jgi:hypothetical protein
MDQPTNNQSPEFEAPQPEVLEVQSDNVAEAAVAEASASSSAPAGESDTPQPSAKPVNKFSYRPSHKATFVGLGVVIAILAANAALIAFLMKNQTDAMSDSSQQGVTLSPQVLDKLGISRNPVGNKGTTLTVGPDAKFNGKMEIGGDTSIAGQLTLNNKMSNSDIGGLEFVNPIIIDNFKLKAKDTIYKYVENNIYGNRSEELPIVKNVTIENIVKTSYKYNQTVDAKAYQIKVKIGYNKDLGYDTNKTLYFVHEESKLSLVEME